MKYLAILLWFFANAAYAQKDSVINYQQIVKEGLMTRTDTVYSKDKTKPFVIIFNDVEKDSEELMVYVNGAKNSPSLKDLKEITKKYGDTKKSDVVFHLDKLFSNRDRDTFHFSVNKRKTEQARVIVVYNSKEDKKDAAQGENTTKAPDIVDYWNMPDTCCLLDMRPFLINPGDNCLDACRQCDYDSLIKGNNIIEYNALTRRTRFVRTTYNEDDKILQWNKRAKLRAGDPVVFVFKNVNPLNQQIKISDSVFLYNVDIPATLATALHLPSDGGSLLRHGTGSSSPQKDRNFQNYLKLRAKLLMLGGEMQAVLQSYKDASPYQYACLQSKMSRARLKIDSFAKHCLLPKEECSETSLSGMLALFGASQQPGDSILADQLQTMYNQFLQSAPVIAYPVLQIPEVDEMKFYAEINPSTNSKYPPLLNSKRPVSLYVTHFFKLDVSTGLYLGFKNDTEYNYFGVNDTTFSLDAAGNRRPASSGGDSVLQMRKRLVNEDMGNQEFGFVSFLHFYYKVSPVINPGIVIGAGFSFSEPIRTRYFTGLSLMLGNKNRICINGGLVFGNYQELSRQYETSGQNYFAPLSETSISYRKRFSHSGFLSISYSLFSLRTKQTEKEGESE